MPIARRYGFLLALSTPALPWQGLWVGSLFGQADLFAGFSLAVVFGLIPVPDWLVGHHPHNPGEVQARVNGLAQQCPARLARRPAEQPVEKRARQSP